MKNTQPLQRNAEMPRPASPMRNCGKRYATEPEATSAAVLLAEKSDRPGTFHVSLECRRCRGWHVTYRKPPEETQEKPKAARDTGPDEKTRKLVLERDGYACVCCGLSIIGHIYSLQHRKRRSQGGTNCPTNLLTVLGDGTQGHHARIDSRIDPHDEEKGYTVRSHQDPAAVGVMLFSAGGSGTAMWPTTDGRWVSEPPEGVAA